MSVPNTNQLVCIRRPEPGLPSLFEEMYLNERLVDVTLCCSDGQLSAHKLVLAACSSYFSGIFDKLANPFHYPVVVIKDMQIEDLKLIVDFMYRGQLTLNRDRLASLLKSAEGLQIAGLSSVNDLVLSNDTDATHRLGNFHSSRSSSNLSRSKRSKKSSSSSSGINRSHLDERDMTSSSEKLLEQSMITEGETLHTSNGNGAQQFNIYANNDPSSSRNNLNTHPLHTPSPSSISVQHHMSTLNPSNHVQHHHHQQQSSHQNQYQQQHILGNHLQVLSDSLTTNRVSLSGLASGVSGSGSSSGASASNLSDLRQSQKGRLHACNICYKTFREKANLKRHLSIHSSDRVVYACPDCNKTFSWKDNYIRHTKTAHHMNNTRQLT